MIEENNNQDELDDLRLNNELKKMQLQQEFGAKFTDLQYATDLHPGLEAQFLEHIEMFEKSFNNSDRISVLNFLNNPEYIKIDDILDSEINAELERIMNLMNENGIELSTICDVEEKELYRFITEELFFEETDNVRIEGMMSCFIYEEFHPNHVYDITNHSEDFMKYFLDKSNDFYTHNLSKQAEDDNVLRNFRDAYDSFTLSQFGITKLDFDADNATVNFNITFSAKIESSNEIQIFSGEGTIYLVYMYDYWCVNSLILPPLS